MKEIRQNAAAVMDSEEICYTWMDYLSEVYDVGSNTCRPTHKSKLNVPLTPSLFESVKLSRRRNVAVEEKREDKKRVMKHKRVAELNIELKKTLSCKNPSCIRNNLIWMIECK